MSMAVDEQDLRPDIVLHRHCGRRRQFGDDATTLSINAAHGGLRPFGGTFLVFSDYMGPAIRMAALMGLPVVESFGASAPARDLLEADGFTPDHVSQRAQGLIERTGYRQQQ